MRTWIRWIEWESERNESTWKGLMGQRGWFYKLNFITWVFGTFWGVIELLRCVTRKNRIVIDIICYLKCILMKDYVNKKFRHTSIHSSIAWFYEFKLPYPSFVKGWIILILLGVDGFFGKSTCWSSIVPNNYLFFMWASIICIYYVSE
jgi:hypothetical protein